MGRRKWFGPNTKLRTSGVWHTAVELSTNSSPSPDSLIQNFEKWSHRHMYFTNLTGDFDVHPWKEPLARVCLPWDGTLSSKDNIFSFPCSVSTTNNTSSLSSL